MIRLFDASTTAAPSSGGPGGGGRTGRRRRGAAGALALAAACAAIGAAGAVGALAWSPAAAQGTVPALVPDEVEGRINGKPARFVAQGDDVLLSTEQAERLGMAYLGGRRIAIGGTPLWIVTLGSVTVAGKTRLGAAAGVVPSVADYFSALRANPAEAVARSREIQLEINGRKVTAYDLGSAGVLLSAESAEAAGLDYRRGRRQDLGGVVAWQVEPPPSAGVGEKPATLIVAEPLAYLRALMAGAGRSP